MPVSARFFDGRSTTPHDVNLHIQKDHLLICSNDDSIIEQWSVNDIVVECANDQQMSLRRQGLPARLRVSDAATLLPHFRRRPRRPLGWRFGALACLVTLGLIYLVIEPLPGLLAALVPASWEARLGDAVQAGQVRAHKICTGADGQQALDRLEAQLGAAGGINRPVKLLVLDDPRVNAFTLPGDRILVMRALIEAARTGDELAGVIAHETGHIAHRDPTRQLLRQFGLSFAAAVIGLGGADSIGQTMVSLSYGRAAETAADAFAVTTLRAAGLRADGLAHFFESGGAEAGTVPGFLSDHPPTENRRAQVATTDQGSPAFTPAEWQAIRVICAPNSNR